LGSAILYNYTKYQKIIPFVQSVEGNIYIIDYKAIQEHYVIHVLPIDNVKDVKIKLLNIRAASVSIADMIGAVQH